MRLIRNPRDLLGIFGKVSTAFGITGVVGLGAAAVLTPVLACCVSDLSVSTVSYTSSAVPTASSLGSAASTAAIGDYLTDTETVTVKDFDYIPAGYYEFALYAGTPPSTCPASQQSWSGATSLPSGSVYDSGAIWESEVDSSTSLVSTMDKPAPGYYQVTTAGEYYWIASYYDPSDGITMFSNCTSEEVQVPLASDAIATQASPTTASVGTSATIGDTATFSNTIVAPTGTVSFQLYSNSSCTDQVSGIGGSGAIATTSGVSTASYTTKWSPTAQGTYYWGITYAGDANNSAFSSCGGTGEQVTVSAASGQVLAASVTTPTTGADLLTPGIWGALAALLGGLLLIAGRRVMDQRRSR